MALLLHITNRDDAGWADNLKEALGDYRVVRRGEPYDPAEIHYVLAWKPEPDIFDDLTNLKAVLSMGAGVDALLRHSRLPDVPIVRFVDAALSESMSDYVTSQVSLHQRLFTRFAEDQRQHRWAPFEPPPARETSVGVMGLGVIGRFALERLRPLGYRLFGWSRTEKQIAGVTTFHGPGGLDAFLRETNILVNLLALTPETEGILNYENFNKLKRQGLEGGPVIVNAARGRHHREDDIVRALTDGTLAAASLDVFETEPLPEDSPLWDLPNCYITPHVAGISSEVSGARYFAGVIRDHEAGKPLPNVVDPARGY